MKIRSVFVAILAITATAWCVAPSAPAAFTSLTSLAGDWQLKAEGMPPQILTLKVVSGGSVLMESMEHESMVTMYHLDKDHVMMTHYCAAQNQPRMQAQISDDGKTFTFDFLDATNLANPADGHMRKMVLTIQDKDHFTEEWFFNKNGKDNEHGVFHLTRKK
ncbi:MAG TPA: hypothetical protein VH724_01560 [Candidatus Angelobacter sp.]|nr:hypothetical protein [Candidatus Angelobacter sp.]